MFGENKTVADNIMAPRGKTHDVHVALSFHRARESTSDKIANFLRMNVMVNPADVLTKHWSHHDIWPALKPIL